MSISGDDVLVHGRIFTADPETPWAEALLIRDGIIDFVGTIAQARKRFAGGQEIDAGDGLVLPGFVDAHAHLLNTGASMLRAHLRSAASVSDVTDTLVRWLAANSEAPRVLGIGWLFSAIPDGLPTRQMLDAVISDRPVYLDASDLHSVWANSAALAELGIDDNTPDPIGGRIVRDSEGVATGLLLENAGYHLAWPVMNVADDAERDTQLSAAPPRIGPPAPPPRSIWGWMPMVSTHGCAHRSVASSHLRLSGIG